MENTKNISSEEELLELLNEGKINDDEYHDLLSAMRKPKTELHKYELPEDIKERWYRNKNLAGIVSIILSLAGILLPLIHILLFFETMRQNNQINSPFYGVVMIEICACVLGFVSWKTKYGKVGATISSIVIILSIPFLS